MHEILLQCLLFKSQLKQFVHLRGGGGGGLISLAILGGGLEVKNEQRFFRFPSEFLAEYRITVG